MELLFQIYFTVYHEDLGWPQNNSAFISKDKKFKHSEVRTVPAPRIIQYIWEQEPFKSWKREAPGCHLVQVKTSLQQVEGTLVEAYQKPSPFNSQVRYSLFDTGGKGWVAKKDGIGTSFDALTSALGTIEDFDHSLVMKYNKEEIMERFRHFKVRENNPNVILVQVATTFKVIEKTIITNEH